MKQVAAAIIDVKTMKPIAAALPELNEPQGERQSFVVVGDHVIQYRFEYTITPEPSKSTRSRGG